MKYISDVRWHHIRDLPWYEIIGISMAMWLVAFGGWYAGG